MKIVNLKLAIIAHLCFHCVLYGQGEIPKSECDMAGSLFRESDFIQGTNESQVFMDSILTICPALAAVWREKSVPFLKRGDFSTWNKLISKAVDLEPNVYLPIRGWCKIKFLRDFSGGLQDLNRFDALAPGRYKIVDDTHIKVWF